MKNIFLLASLFFVCVINLYAQQGVVTSTGVINSSSGSMSFAVGQMAYIIIPGPGSGARQDMSGGPEGAQLNSEDETIITVYPNPSEGMVTIQLCDDETTDKSFMLLDVQGKLIYQEDFNSSQTLVDLSHFASGIYFIKVMFQSSELKSIKIIKN